MNACKNLKALNYWQYDKLKNHIDKNQYYLGEKAHHFISFHDAEMDFLDHFLGEVGKDLRKEFCTKHCPYFGTCDLAHKIISKDS